MSRGQVARLYDHLDPRERALLSIRHCIAGTEEPPGIRRAMPAQQGPQFNWYIGLANATWRVLGTATALSRAELETSACGCAGCARCSCGATTGSGCGRRATCTCARWSPSRSTPGSSRKRAAPPIHWTKRSSSSPSADWSRRTTRRGRSFDAEMGREIRAAVRAKALVARGRGKQLAIEYGSVCDWLDAKPSVYGDLALHLEVVPDDQASGSRRTARTSHGCAS